MRTTAEQYRKELAVCKMHNRAIWYIPYDKFIPAMEEFASKERAEGKKEGIELFSDVITRFERSPMSKESILKIRDELLKEF